MQCSIELDHHLDTSTATVQYRIIGFTSLGMLDVVAGHAQVRSRFACTAGLTTEVCLYGRAYNNVGLPAWGDACDLLQRQVPIPKAYYYTTVTRIVVKLEQYDRREETVGNNEQYT